MFGRRERENNIEEMIQRAIQATAWGEWPGAPGLNQSWAGQRVTTSSSLQLLAVYGSTRFITEGITTLPVDQFRKRRDGTNEEMPKAGWLLKPTTDLEWIPWSSQVLVSMLLAGNAYIHKVYDGEGNIVELPVFHPDDVTVTREFGRKVMRVNGHEINPFEILHIPAMMFPGADVGLSPVEMARQNVGAGLAVEEFGARFFGQGANLGGVIEDPSPPDPERAKMLAKAWARLHGGNKNAHLPGVLQGGAVWKQVQVSPEQAQFLATRQYTAAEIASHMFLIDPSEFGFQPERGSAIVYGNLEQRNARKVQVTFLPWVIRLEMALSSLLPPGQHIKLNVEGLLRGDSQTRFATYSIASAINTAAAALDPPQPPLLATAEMRALENLAPYAGEIPKAAAPVAAPAPADAGKDAITDLQAELRSALEQTTTRHAADLVKLDTALQRVADQVQTDLRAELARERQVALDAPVVASVERLRDEAARQPRSLEVIRDDDGRISGVREAEVV